MCFLNEGFEVSVLPTCYASITDLTLLTQQYRRQKRIASESRVRSVTKGTSEISASENGEGTATKSSSEPEATDKVEASALLSKNFGLVGGLHYFHYPSSVSIMP